MIASWRSLELDDKETTVSDRADVILAADVSYTDHLIITQL